jgi:hypothetical protein
MITRLGDENFTGSSIIERILCRELMINLFYRVSYRYVPRSIVEKTRKTTYIPPYNLRLKNEKA